MLRTNVERLQFNDVNDEFNEEVFEVLQNTVTSRDEECVEEHTDLTNYARQCEYRIKPQEQERYRQLSAMQYTLQSQKVEIEFVSALNPSDKGFFLRRLWSFLTSEKFCAAYKARCYKDVASLVMQEMIIYGAFGIDLVNSTLKRFWTPVLEAMEKFLKKNMNMGKACNRNVIIGVMMIIASLFLTRRDRKTWAELAPDVVRETVKVSVVLMTSFWISIPVCGVIDKIADSHRFQRKMSWQAVKPALWSAICEIPWIGEWFRVTRAPVEACELHHEFHCHDAFLCPITLTIIEDPVVLHGKYYSRAAILEWLRKNSTHPHTRKRAIRGQVTEPDVEYMDFYQNYVRTRALVLRDAQLVATSS